MKVDQSTSLHTFISIKSHGNGELFLRDDDGYVTLGRITHRNEPSIHLSYPDIMRVIKILLKMRKVLKQK